MSSLDRIANRVVRLGVAGVLTIVGSGLVANSVAGSYDKSPQPTLTPTSTPTRYRFGELWSKYLDVQVQPGSPKGKVVDFGKYCTRTANSCGFNDQDPDFNKQFHGHISGYRVDLINAEWVYTEIK